MNGHENGLLQQISNKLDKLDDKVDDTNVKIAKANTNIATTQADVKNLIGWTQQMEHKFENLENGGCSQGKVLAERVDLINKAQNKEIDEVKADLKTKASKKQAAGLSASAGAAAGSIITALIQGFFAIFR